MTATRVSESAKSTNLSKQINRLSSNEIEKRRGEGQLAIPRFGIVPTASSTLVNCNWRPDVRKRSDDNDDDKRRQTGDTWPKRGSGGGVREGGVRGGRRKPLLAVYCVRSSLEIDMCDARLVFANYSIDERLIYFNIIELKDRSSSNHMKKKEKELNKRAKNK